MSDTPQFDMLHQRLAMLRQPFPPNQISKLPKPTKKQTEDVKADFKKGIRCKVCGTWHHPDVIHLDYVGHAALTDRMLDVDPGWSWEPLSMSPDGLPVMDSLGGMWIKLTVCGVTRIGYGHAGDKTGGDAIKEVIGDALRNAAMRFGCALDLWHKGDLHAHLEADDSKAREEWLAGRKSAIMSAANVGELKKIIADAIEKATNEDDGRAVDQINLWAEEKKASAKTKEHA